MSKEIKLFFSSGEGMCYGCNQSASTNATLQPIAMILTENSKTNNETYCRVCAIKKLEQLKQLVLSE
ncbi:MAG: hypothetical protein MRERC_2c002 [Mycoplasmataceae bacterium RC_NB112A]|nr:MAG: hypothetical protein MRERC_6c099 [Mycoplasmataceae bacterium RC_NB112A]KLL02132.1 MAG: hypothetical protein MRERC_4c091 [Mycoplasmataceae bacterium RC_NB112A]KLL02176.1 MAG: hypothetical protein MRERC_4c151 [Mycoplasmataceae bacterium RC_NB112A]KLL02294.1 MAG: hypothetical protein MRERC_2c002 [Mycoplasmataceae bacterium RC_NB112A]